MIPFTDIHPDVAEVLQREGIKETDLFNHYSDLYVGCKDLAQANRIRNAGKWRSMSDTFTPQRGSDMDSYPVGLDISLAYYPNYPESLDAASLKSH